MRRTMVSSAPPSAILGELKRSTEGERPNPFSSSGFAGSEPFIGLIGDGAFRIQRRHQNRNGLAPQLYGQLRPAESGTHVDYEITMRRQTKAVLSLYFVMVIGLGLPMSILINPTPGSLSPVVWTVLALASGAAFIALGLIGWAEDAESLRRHLEQSVRKAEGAERN